MDHLVQHRTGGATGLRRGAQHKKTQWRRWRAGAENSDSDWTPRSTCPRGGGKGIEEVPAGSAAWADREGPSRPGERSAGARNARSAERLPDGSGSEAAPAWPSALGVDKPAPTVPARAARSTASSSATKWRRPIIFSRYGRIGPPVKGAPVNRGPAGPIHYSAAAFTREAFWISTGRVGTSPMGP